MTEDFDDKNPEELYQAGLQSMFNLIGMGASDATDYPKSLMLLKPLKESYGGVTHGGGTKFVDLADPAYQDFLEWL